MTASDLTVFKNLLKFPNDCYNKHKHKFNQSLSRERHTVINKTLKSDNNEKQWCSCQATSKE